MDIILLAAGRGTRLGRETSELPKTLLEIKGRPLCHHIIDSLLDFDPDSIVIVGGFHFSKLKQSLLFASAENSTACCRDEGEDEPRRSFSEGGSRLRRNFTGKLGSLLPSSSSCSKKINLIYNPAYKMGNLITLLCAREIASAPFALFNADHYYSGKILKHVFEGLKSIRHVTAVCDFDRSLTADDMKVELDSNRRLISMSKKLPKFDAGYIGITLVPKDKLEIYWEGGEETLREEGELSCAESILNRLVHRGEKVEILDVSGSWWFEVDTPEDLEKAREMMKLK